MADLVIIEAGQGVPQARFPAEGLFLLCEEARQMPRSIVSQLTNSISLSRHSFVKKGSVGL
ncbi:hypothetical protein FHS20_004288 [Phyllobacterium endophyticum]|nr:hypothetical protein [Phyllobacterium endophyticum]